MARSPKSQQDVIEMVDNVLEYLNRPKDNFIKDYLNFKIPEGVLPVDMINKLECWGANIEETFFDAANRLDFNLSEHDLRCEAVDLCGFPILTKPFIDDLANCIRYVTKKDNPKVVDLMAGTGALAKCLNDAGIDTIPVDNFDSNKLFRGYTHQWMNVIDDNAYTFVQNNIKDYDMFIMSWPPYEECISSEILKYLINNNISLPGIYIGEGYGGCTANEDFFDLYEDIEVDKELNPNQHFQNWTGVNDSVQIIRPCHRT